MGDNGVVLKANANAEVTLIHEQSELFLYGLSVVEPMPSLWGNGRALGSTTRSLSVYRRIRCWRLWHDGMRAMQLAVPGTPLGWRDHDALTHLLVWMHFL